MSCSWVVGLCWEAGPGLPGAWALAAIVPQARIAIVVVSTSARFSISTSLMRTTLRNAKGSSEFSGWPGRTHFIWTPDKRATAVSVNLRPGLRLFAQHGDGRCSSRISSATLVRESLIGRPFFNLSDTNSPVRLRWAGSVCRPGQHWKPWRSQVAGAFQLPQLRDAAFPAFPQFCLKMFTFAGQVLFGTGLVEALDY